jgi:hypothetical protein
MQVAVLLALHGVVTKVREDAETTGAELLANFGRDLSDLADVVFPEFGLSCVDLRHGEEHHRHPAQDVLDDDDLVVLVHDVRGLAPGYDIAKDTVWLHSARRS